MGPLETSIIIILIVLAGVFLGSYGRQSTRNIRHLRITDYLPIKDRCTPHTCFMAIAWMLMECGHTKDEALSISKGFVEVLNAQLKGIHELIETYEDGALTPIGGKKLIVEWIDNYERNNHHLLKLYLSALKESMADDGTARVLDIAVVADKYMQNGYPKSVWRGAASAAANRGTCPDPEFIADIELPMRIALDVQIEDTDGFLDTSEIRFHYG